MYSLEEVTESLKRDRDNMIEVLRQRDEGIEDNTTFTQLVSVVEANIGKYKPRFVCFRGFTGTELDYELNNIDTSLVTSMSNMFDSCRNLISIPQLDTRNVTSMNSMFNDCRVLQSIPQLDTSKVTNMSYIFRSCQNLQSIQQLDTSNVQYIGDAFTTCNSLINLGGFKDLGKAYSTTSGANNSIYTLSLSNSSLLTHESAMNVINNLYDIATKGCKVQQVRFHANVIALLTEEEIAIATNKGWSVTA